MDTGKARERAEFLRERYPFAAEVMTLYLALLEVWVSPPIDPQDIVKATEACGPAALGEAVRDLDPIGVMRRWSTGLETSPVETYLARACLRGITPPVRLDGPCPQCGGQPQLSIQPLTDEPLVSGRRQLMCARCQHVWNHSGSSCPSCGETEGAKHTFYGESDELPHLRVDACSTCQRYLIDVDLRRDPRAVPEVDELAALPLDLYAAEHGLTKITPNLMGF
ncbi:MAG TPA: formate dehydrogenase accessory protein FdhE [Candidatus Limnocylindrales bacterium]|nr:formate dehydrogenase accessory protein FdhE [Candidatus Limnocylindrales bacterium]